MADSSIRFVTTRDERGAAFMADTYGALTVNVPRDPSPSEDQVHRAAHVLESASYPVVLAGPGVARDHAVDALIRFAERLTVPVATTFLGKGVFPDDHPCALGTIGFMV